MSIKYWVELSPTEQEIKGFYNSDVHDESTLPSSLVEITKEEWQYALDINATHVQNNVFVRLTIQPTAAELLERAIRDRKTAYEEEADPLFMEWQFDMTPASEQIWRNKVNEIKQRIPLPQGN